MPANISTSLCGRELSGLMRGRKGNKWKDGLRPEQKVAFLPKWVGVQTDVIFQLAANMQTDYGSHRCAGIELISLDLLPDTMTLTGFRS